MRKLLLVSLTTVLFAWFATAATGRLNLFIWSEYLDPAVVTDFEDRFDCKVTIDLYEDEGAMMAKLQAGGAALYDVVVPPQNKIGPLVKLGLLSPLRHERIPNLKNLDEKFRDPPFDRNNKYSVAYQWGTVGLFVRRPAKGPLPDSWSVLFDPKAAAGAFVLLDNPRDLIGAALKYRGHSFNSVDPAQLKEARDLIVATKRRCLGFEGSVGGRNRVLAGAAGVAMVYSTEAARGMVEDAGTTYVIPKEGSQIWQDNLAVLAQAPHRDLAEDFINFLLDGSVGARISHFTKSATPNKAALLRIKPEDRHNPAIYPPEELKLKLEFLEEVGARSRLYDEVWTQIKAR